MFMYVHGVFELSEVQGRAELGPGRSQELRGSPELQNGGLTALEDAWMTISRLRHFHVKSGRFLCFWSVHVAQGGVDLGPRRSQEVRGSPELQNGGLRALEDAWMTISRFRHFPVRSGRRLCFWSVQVAQGGVKLGPRRYQELRGSPELQNGGLRMEDSQIGDLRGLAKLRMAGFWMHQVLLLRAQ